MGIASLGYDPVFRRSVAIIGAFKHGLKFHLIGGQAVPNDSFHVLAFISDFCDRSRLDVIVDGFGDEVGNAATCVHAVVDFIQNFGIGHTAPFVGLEGGIAEHFRQTIHQ